MKRVRREEVLDHVTYGERRDVLRPRALAEKDVRRVQVGEHLTFLFENTATVRHQIHEMLRIERIVRESDVQHEIDTYNELLGGPGVLGCTLLVGIEDAAERERLLVAWLQLPEHLYVRLDDGRLARARVDERQRGRGRLSSVQYLKFDVGGGLPIAVGCDLPGASAETALQPGQRAALSHDLGPDA
ncbi:MAG: DUF3501 family protein [Planctomycetota bacterium]|nr:DUF3501 family protein [Planctomycetota bacterium]